MKTLFSRFAPLLLLMLLFSACFEPETPQETAEAFWNAVTKDDARGAVRYSTLEDVRHYDAFGKVWGGLKPTWGRVVIDGDSASVAAEFNAPGRPAEESRHVVTYLVRQEGRWTVDYARTSTALQGGVFTLLLGELGKLGRQLSEQLAASSEDIRLEMDAMAEKMEAYSETLNEQASESIERHGDALRRSIDELAASAREALKDPEANLTAEERRALDDVAGDLEEESERLCDPDVASMAESSKNAEAAQQRLITINKEALEQYKRQWRAWQEQFEAEARRFLEELNRALEPKSDPQNP